MRVLSEDGGLIRTSIGMTIGTERFDDTVYDTLIIGGGGELAPPNARLDRFRQAVVRTKPPDHVDLQRRVRSRGGGPARRPARDDALDLRSGVPGAIPQSEDGGGSHLHP